MRTVLAWVALFFASSTAYAIEIPSTVSATVSHVIDGDTIEVVTEGEKFQVRLDAIDAPELKQEFGDRSRAASVSHIGFKTVRIDIVDKDKYGRCVGRVWLGERFSVNLWLVDAGLAWHYKKYSDSATLARAERDAKDRKHGLWATGAPVPPWEWRDRGNAALQPVAISALGKTPTNEELAAAREARRREREQRSKKSAVQRSPSSTASRSVSEPSTVQLTHWITSSSGVRHNSSCRWYANSKGRRRGPNEGRACKVCGG